MSEFCAASVSRGPLISACCALRCVMRYSELPERCRMHQAIAVMPMISCSGGLPSLRELEDFLELSDRRSARPAGVVSLYEQHEYSSVCSAGCKNRGDVPASSKCARHCRTSRDPQIFPLPSSRGFTLLHRAVNPRGCVQPEDRIAATRALERAPQPALQLLLRADSRATRECNPPTGAFLRNRQASRLIVRREGADVRRSPSKTSW